MLGLSPGDETFTPMTRTESHFEMTKFICWLFWIVMPFILIEVLESIVNACREKKTKKG